MNSYGQPREERFDSDLTAEEILSSNLTKVSKAVNISRSGALLVSEKQDDDRNRYVLQLRLHLPCYQKSILTQVQVVRENIVEGKRYRGVRFAQMSADDRDLLNAYTAALRIGCAQN